VGCWRCPSQVLAEDIKTTPRCNCRLFDAGPFHFLLITCSSATAYSGNMVHLLDLPAELFHEILVFACLVRGLRRALRLKLVCAAFQCALQPALFASGLLDNYDGRDGQCLALWQVKRYPESKVQLWHQYLIYRIRGATENDDGPRQLLLTRRVAEVYCAETGATSSHDLDVCVAALAWLILDRAAGGLGQGNWVRLRGDDSDLGCRHDFYEDRDGPHSLGAHLLSVAAYFNNMSLARNLLSKGHSPTEHGYLVPSAMETAAFAGHGEMLLLLQEQLPASESPADGDRDRYWYGGCKADSAGSVYGAALRGDLDMTELAFMLYAPSNDTNGPEAFVNTFVSRWGRIDQSDQPLNLIYLALRATRDWAVFKYLSAAIGCRHVRDESTEFSFLSSHVRRGNVGILTNMVSAYEFGFGQTFQKNLCALLRSAVRQCHDDVVDFILDHMDRQPGGIASHFASECGCITRLIRGVDPPSGPPLRLLAAAAATGSISMVKKLVAKGLRVERGQDSGWPAALLAALEQEHLEMANLLLTLRGPTGRLRKKLLTRLDECGLGGLDSVNDFIQAKWPSEQIKTT
jgi:hypothetical protein